MGDDVNDDVNQPLEAVDKADKADKAAAGKRVREGSPPEETPLPKTAKTLEEKTPENWEEIMDMDTSIEEVEETNEVSRESLVAEAVASIKDATIKIRKATSKEGNKSLHFTRNDQAIVIDATDVVYGSTLDLLVELQRLQAENASLKAKLEKSEEKVRAMAVAAARKPVVLLDPIGARRQAAAKTPASASAPGSKPKPAQSKAKKAGPKSGQATTTVTNGYAAAAAKAARPKSNLPPPKVTVRTPPKEVPRKLETVVKIDGKNAEEVEAIFKRNLKVKDIGGPLAGIFRLANGGLALKSRDADQKTKLEAALAKESELRFADGLRFNPTATLTGLKAGMKEDELLEQLYEENEDVWQDCTLTDFRQSVKILARRKCRNQNLENVTLTMDPDLHKRVIEAGKVSVGYLMTYVEQECRIVRCYNCSRYGHTAKKCENKTCCPKCGGEHDLKKCKATEVTCVNCKSAGKREIAHRASNIRCPEYQRRLLEKLSRTING